MNNNDRISNAIDRYFTDNYPETIVLNNLYARHILHAHVQATRYKTLIDKLLKANEPLIFSRYLSRDQLGSLVNKAQQNEDALFRALTHKVELSIDSCSDEDLQCRINTFQLFGVSGRAQHFDFIKVIERSKIKLHATLEFSILNLSIFTSRYPFDISKDVFNLLDRNDQLRRFYFSYLRYYYNGIDGIFSTLAESIISKEKSRLAILLPALDLLLNQNRHRHEIHDNIIKYQTFFSNVSKITSKYIYTRIKDTFDKAHSKYKIPSGLFSTSSVQGAGYLHQYRTSVPKISAKPTKKELVNP